MFTKMLEFSKNDGLYILRERFGLKHLQQVIELPLEGYEEASHNIILRDLDTQKVIACQRPDDNTYKMLAILTLKPYQTRRLALESAETNPLVENAAYVKHAEDFLVLGNSRVTLKLPAAGEEKISASSNRISGIFPLGPLRGISFSNGKSWLGRSYIDSHAIPTRSITKVIMEGDLRCQIQVRTEFQGDGFYQAEFTLDAGQPFAHIKEEFRLHEGAQVVFDFPADKFSGTSFILDSTPAYQTGWINWGLDHRLASLGAWSQQSQLSLSDGYAFEFMDNNIFGCFTIDGGDWQGNRLNALEAWVRRWRNDDPLSRRLTPGEAKADGNYGRELIPARDRTDCVAHLSLEGWLNEGKREWGLLLCPEAEFVPPAGDDRNDGYCCDLGHFEDSARIKEYHNYQALLRRLHIRHGVMPLQKQLDICIEWQDSELTEKRHISNREFLFSPLMRAHLDKEKHNPKNVWTHESAEPQQLVNDMQTYLRTRIETFWYGAGIASTNPVSSRRVAPLMFLYEYLHGENRLDEVEQKYCKACFSFLSTLMYSANYYPGWSAMLPADDSNSLDPVLRGMANQNFYTDVYNIPGTAGQVFRNHPHATQWVENFNTSLGRQLEFHVYPQSGLWEESHTYYQHVLSTLLPLLLRMQNDQNRDWFADSALRRMAAASLLQVTPPDSLYGGRRHLIPFGDHGADPAAFSHIWAALAQGFSVHDRKLAAEFLWMCTNTGNNIDENISNTRSMTGLAPQQPELCDQYIEGLGIAMRENLTGKTGKKESLLALRSGQAWGHHHNDEGSIYFHADGQMLLGDSACGENQEGNMKVCGRGHSRWLPEGVDVLNYLWRFNRGYAVSHDFSGYFAQTVSFSPVVLNAAALPNIAEFSRPLRHYRGIMRIAPGTYLLADRTIEDIGNELNFHFHTDTVIEDNKKLSWHGKYENGTQLNLQAIDGIESGHVTGKNKPRNDNDAGSVKREKKELDKFTTSHLVLQGTKKSRESLILLQLSLKEQSSQWKIHKDTSAGNKRDRWTLSNEEQTVGLQRQNAGIYTIRDGKEQAVLILSDTNE